MCVRVSVFGCLLGPSWRLDRRLGRSWGRLGPSKNPCQNRSKIDQKSTKNQPKMYQKTVSGEPWGLLAAKTKKDKKRYELLGPHGRILGPSWKSLGAVLALGSPSWAALGRLESKKNRCKNRSKKRCILDSIFGRILVDFWTQNGGMLAPKSIKNRCQLGRAIF